MTESRVREGTGWLLAAQGIFFLTSYVMHIVLGRTMGPVEYGLFGVVLYTTNMIRTFVQSGIPMALTRYVSADPPRAEAAYRSSFRLQFVLSAIMGLAFFATATPLAKFLEDERLADAFRISAPVILFFGLFFLIFQYYNGLKEYRRQCVILSGSYLLRAGLAILLVMIGFGLSGAVAGMVIAALISWIWAAIGRKKARTTEVFPSGTLVVFAAPLILAAVAQALLMDLDIMFVKRMIPEESSAGWYTSAKTLAQMMPFGFYALSSALYPAVSAAHASGDAALLRKYTEQSNRLLLAVSIPLVIIGFRNAEGILNLVYGHRYLEGASALPWLILSFSLLSFFIIHKTILAGCGYPRVCGALTILLLPIYVVLQIVLIPLWGMKGAAIASVITFTAGVIGSIVVTYIRVKAGFHLPSVVRIILASLVVLVIDSILSHFSAPFMIKLCSSACAYLAALRLLGELRFQLPRLNT